MQQVGSAAGRADRLDKQALLQRFKTQMLATARRYSAGPHDAEDAYQRAAEILLTHSPTGTDDELCRWLRTTVKHEALAIRKHQARQTPHGEAESLPQPAGGAPDTFERVERRERALLGAQALARLKPHEVRCLLLKAEGYSYAEICQTTGWSYTKVNRCITEGRRAFFERVEGIEAGLECDRVGPMLSAFADGELLGPELDETRTHLKTCTPCRALLRGYRGVPAKVAAIAGPLPLAVGQGPVRSALDAIAASVQHKVGLIGDRLQPAAELVTGQKVATAACCAAALAGGGAVTAPHLPSIPIEPAVREEAKAPQRTAPPPPVAAPQPPPVPSVEPGATTDVPSVDQSAAATQSSADPAGEQPPKQTSTPADEFAPQAHQPVTASEPAPSAKSSAVEGSGQTGSEFAP